MFRKTASWPAIRFFFSDAEKSSIMYSLFRAGNAVCRQRSDGQTRSETERKIISDMNETEYNYSSYSQEALRKNPETNNAVQKSILKAYGLMFTGLLVSGIVAFVFYYFGLTLQMLMNFPMLALILPIVQIGLTIAFTFQMNRATATSCKVIFFVYAFTMGISLSTLAYAYTTGEIFAAFLIAALYFGTLVFIGVTTKKDLTKLGTISIAALVVLLISQPVLMIFRAGIDTRLIAAAGLLIFAGLTAWDVQRLNKTMLYADGEPVAREKWAVFFALELYLDFINIFLYILRLLGSRSSR